MPHPDVVDHRHLAEGPRHLVGAGDAPRDPPVGGDPGDVLAAKEHPARIGALFAHEEGEGGGLAGAVGADEAERLAPVHVHAQAIHRDQAAEPLRGAAQLQQGRRGGHGAAAAPSALPRAKESRRPASRRMA